MMTISEKLESDIRKRIEKQDFLPGREDVLKELHLLLNSEEMNYIKAYDYDLFATHDIAGFCVRECKIDKEEISKTVGEMLSLIEKYNLEFEELVIDLVVNRKSDFKMDHTEALSEAFSEVKSIDDKAIVWGVKLNPGQNSEKIKIIVCYMKDKS